MPLRRLKLKIFADSPNRRAFFFFFFPMFTELIILSKLTDVNLVLKESRSQCNCKFSTFHLEDAFSEVLS